MSNTTYPKYSSLTATKSLDVDIASLAVSASLVLGNQSAVVLNTGVLGTSFDDVQLMGQVTSGTIAVSGGTFELWLFRPTKLVGGVYSWPIATATELTLTKAARTFVAEQKAAALVVGDSVTINTTDNTSYTFGCGSVKAAFGGVMPSAWGAFVTQSSDAVLNASAALSWLHYIGINELRE